MRRNMNGVCLLNGKHTNPIYARECPLRPEGRSGAAKRRWARDAAERAAQTGHGSPLKAAEAPRSRPRIPGITPTPLPGRGGVPLGPPGRSRD